ncbi:hypothetical protein NQZ68_033223 [Dissostichus eleginoides]|uniref:Urokinase plasminogen activator surface receptor n=1 Tax=Dissostichus eleginoides TaxID=100907 RepID=A0AAD9C310_DISEL|nr:hypothetical protein NQZ68_033223 [Dissostichus eleginoides]KAK1895002.1 Urokinase plasminogen activator surface receptor [Dissostichus eleginoides]
MHLITLILGTVLLHQAYSLECHCSQGSGCTNSKIECPSGQSCSSERHVSYSDGSKMSDVNLKGCALPERCVNRSMNLGVVQTLISSSCCATKLCNSANAPEPVQSPRNGKSCFSCVGQTCTSSLACTGNEEFCYSASVTVDGQHIPVRGCVPKEMCQGHSSCCEGDLCNSASSTSAGLLLLMAPLLSLGLLS